VIDNSSIVVASASQASQELPDEAIVLHLDRGTYFSLNPVGTRVWQLIQKPTRVEAVRDALVREFHVDVPECESDLHQLLSALAREGLIDVTNGS
jgi:hypothetical protein